MFLIIVADMRVRSEFVAVDMLRTVRGTAERPRLGTNEKRVFVSGTEFRGDVGDGGPRRERPERTKFVSGTEVLGEHRNGQTAAAWNGRKTRSRVGDGGPRR